MKFVLAVNYSIYVVAGEFEMTVDVGHRVKMNNLPLMH